MPIAPSTYHRQHQPDATRRSTRAHRDATLRIEIQRICDEQHQVYGPRKVWKQLRSKGMRVARCTVGCLMRARGLEGAVRGRAWVLTTHAADGGRPADLVDRQSWRHDRISSGSQPSRTWRPWSGFVYVAFVIDVFARRIVGWRVAAARGIRLCLEPVRESAPSRPNCSDGKGGVPLQSKAAAAARIV